MIDLDALNKYRIAVYGYLGDSTGGAFLFELPPSKENKGWRAIKVIASADEGWDHVSVSLDDRTPTWDEMEFIRKKFFKPDEVVVQFHVPASQHINCHPYCLHMWRSWKQTYDLPPPIMVGPTNERR
jgi:hypothetical protein